MIKLWWQWEDLLEYIKKYYPKNIYDKWCEFTPEYEFNNDFIHNKKENMQLFYNIYECFEKGKAGNVIEFAIKKFVEDLLYIENTKKITKDNYITFPKNGCALLFIETMRTISTAPEKDIITIASVIRIY